MPARHDLAALSSPIDQMSTPRDRIGGATGGLIPQPASDFPARRESSEMILARAAADVLTVGLIDGYQFSRECLMRALEGLIPHMVILPFASVQACICTEPENLGLVIYYPHSDDTSEGVVMPNIDAIRQEFPAVPLVVISDAEYGQQPMTLHSTMKSGARGFIPTRTIGIDVTIAAIQFVIAGGTFAPLNWLAAPQDHARQQTVRQNLTPHQIAVLSLLQQGKRNIIIARELDISVGMVKVHVRHIMRKLGVTNRAQAAYRAHQMHLCDSAGDRRPDGASVHGNR
jgi:DNA-binding NarL/FixJ family response regulator